MIKNNYLYIKLKLFLKIISFIFSRISSLITVIFFLVYDSQQISNEPNTCRVWVICKNDAYSFYCLWKFGFCYYNNYHNWISQNESPDSSFKITKSRLINKMALYFLILLIFLGIYKLTIKKRLLFNLSEILFPYSY